MSGKVFLDTNIFLYAYDESEQLKKSVARELVRNTAMDGSGIVSYQVIQEFFNVALKKNSVQMRLEEAQLFIATIFRPLLAVHSSIALFGEAIHLQERHRLSWYDSLIVAAAQQAKCSILYTEDLQHGQRFGDLVVQNPFR
jgi:predicted nucleic acid-binding protein